MLEADVFEILKEFGKIQPSQIRTILEEKDYYQKTDSRTLDVQISRILSKFQEEGFVSNPQKIANNKYYSLTKKGREKAPFSIIQNRLIDEQSVKKNFEILLPNLFKISLNNNRPKNISADTIEAIEEILPTQQAFADILFYIDPENKNRINDVVQSFNDSHLENIAYQFIMKCQNALLKNTDYKHWDGYRDGPFLIEKLIDNMKASLNFDAVLSIHFNGRKIIEEFNWKKDFEKIKKYDKEEKEIREVFNSKISQKSKARESWINWFILEELNKINYNLEKFNYTNHSVGSDVQSIITQFSENIVDVEQRGKIIHGGPIPPSIAELTSHIKNLLEDGIIEVAVTFKVNQEKLNKKQRETINEVYEETGYVLP